MEESLLQMITIYSREYAAVQQEKYIVSKCGAESKDIVHPHFLSLGLSNELIAHDYACITALNVSITILIYHCNWRR